MPTASWYPDPQNPELARYWDGERWTDKTRPKHELVPHRAPQPARVETENVADVVMESNELKPQDPSPKKTGRTKREKDIYSLRNLKRSYKSKELSREEYKHLKKEATLKQSNTRFTSVGGTAFISYLISYVAVAGVAVYASSQYLFDMLQESIGQNWNISNISVLVDSLSALLHMTSEYQEFRLGFIICILASTAIPFLIGLIGTFKKRGRVWAVATMLLSLFFNPAVVLFTVVSSLSWWVIIFG